MQRDPHAPVGAFGVHRLELSAELRHHLYETIGAPAFRVLRQDSSTTCSKCKKKFKQGEGLALVPFEFAPEVLERVVRIRAGEIKFLYPDHGWESSDLDPVAEHGGEG